MGHRIANIAKSCCQIMFINCLRFMECMLEFISHVRYSRHGPSKDTRCYVDDATCEVIQSLLWVYKYYFSRFYSGASRLTSFVKFLRYALFGDPDDVTLK